VCIWDSISPVAAPGSLDELLRVTYFGYEDMGIQVTADFDGTGGYQEITTPLDIALLQLAVDLAADRVRKPAVIEEHMVATLLM